MPIECRLEEYELLPQLVLPLHVLVLPVQHKQSQAASSSLKAVLHNQHTHIGTEFLSGQRSHVAGHTFGKFRQKFTARPVNGVLNDVVAVLVLHQGQPTPYHFVKQRFLGFAWSSLDIEKRIRKYRRNNVSSDRGMRIGRGGCATQK